VGEKAQYRRLDPGDLEANLRAMKLFARMARSDPQYWVWFNEFINKSLEIIREAHRDERLREIYLKVLRSRPVRD